MIHFAGPSITIDERWLRQRCAWCGAVLVDVDVTAIMVPDGQDPTSSTSATAGCPQARALTSTRRLQGYRADLGRRVCVDTLW